MARFLIVLAAAAILAGTALTGGYLHDAYFTWPSKDAAEVSVTVAAGARGGDVIDDLKEKGIVTSPLLFKLYLKVSGEDAAFQSGTFSLQQGMSFREIMRNLTRAETNEIQVTIPEGFTLKQIGERVRAALPAITEEEWNAAVGASPEFATESAAWFVGQTKPAGVDLEGYLFPDTYRFFADATAKDVVTKMVDAMSAKLGAELATVADENGMSKPGAMTPHEVLTLASVIQREVQSEADMKDVADLFLKRLEMGMPLQADSTIAYYLGKTSAEMTLDDLKNDEPYNTYTRAGLPPGPIASPGLDAIDAVLHPTPNPYLYFLTTSDGTVMYASTFEEHVANKQRYLR